MVKRFLFFFLVVVSFIPFPHKYIVSVSNVNYGGCGYYAYYLSGKLSGATIVSIRSGMHYMGYRGGCYWDNSGVYLPHVIWLWSKGDIEPISREELRGLLNNRTLWNSRFDLMDTSAIITKIYKSK